jgi:hypothetical protein
MISARLAFALVTAAVAAAGCFPTIGRDFVRPDAANVRLGETTLAQVRERYGQPRSERSWGRGGTELAREAGAPFGVARVDGVMHELDYYFQDRSAPASAPGIEPSRSLKMWFWNGRLVGYLAHSSFQADATAFDEAKVAAIVPWKSFRPDVTAALGEPSGMRIYPMVQSEDLQVMTYYAFEFDRGAGQTRSKTLHVLTDSIGVVRDVRFDGSTRAIPPPLAPATVPVQVTVPPPPKKK